MSRQLPKLTKDDILLCATDDSASIVKAVRRVESPPAELTFEVDCGLETFRGAPVALRVSIECVDGHAFEDYIMDAGGLRQFARAIAQAMGVPV